MKQRKKIKRETFSTAPRHLNRRQRAAYEVKHREDLQAAERIKRMLCYGGGLNSGGVYY